MNIFQKVTLKNLKENRTRTLVTIVGIILSAAMFTAVTLSVSSLLHYLIQHAIYTEGNWYGSVYGLPLEKVEAATNDSSVEQTAAMESLGFSLLSDGMNTSKPYLSVYGMDIGVTDMLPIHLTEGRLPQNSKEILLPKHLADNGGVTYALNDAITLEIGIRVASDGTVLDNHIGYDPEESLPETLTNIKSHTYTVTGFYERPSFEDYSAPGYTALTVSELPSDGTYDMYFRTVSRKGITSYIETHFNDYGSTINYTLLRLHGDSGESTYNAVLIRLASILVFIIMLGSISLIYNAFSISISERTRQFGLLSSIGATRRQLTGSVLFEALSLSVIGIPLGILSGILGISATFYFTGDLIAGYLYPEENVTLTLHPSVSALLIAIAVSLITILISAYLPARRALKKSALDAIRQTSDIAIRPGKVKTSPVTQNFFGFEGMLATKNYKRNGKKYRATVFSLFISVVLFISASTLSAYLVKSIGDVSDKLNYDVSYYFYPNEDNTDYSPDKLKKLLSGINGIKASAYFSPFHIDASIDSNALSKDYIRALGLEEKPEDLPDTNNFFLAFVDDTVFRNYLKEHHLPEENYFNSKQPQAVMVDALKIYSSNESRYYTPSMFSEEKDANIVFYLSKDKEGYDSLGTQMGEDNKPYFNFSSQDNPEETISLSREEACDSLPLSYDAILSEPPKAVPAQQYTANLYYPYSMMESVFSGLDSNAHYNVFSEGIFSYDTVNVDFTFQAEDHAKSYADIKKLLTENGLSANSLTDYAASNESDLAMVTVINIFSYGFIILISLIAAANVFNTISTNIILRRREFAMLQSMGLAPDGFRKMMNFECMLYGFKGLLYGLPVSVLIAFWIYRSVSNGLEIDFFIPWYSIVIAIGSVFVVVFSTMLYSMHKIKRENIMDILKNENV